MVFPRRSFGDYYGQIIPYPDERTVVQNVLNHQPATFRVDFANPGIAPKLTLLSLDGIEICTDTNYPPPHSWAKLSYKLFTYTTGSNNSPPPNVPNVPISLIPVKLDTKPNPSVTPPFQTIPSINSNPFLTSVLTVNSASAEAPTNKFKIPSRKTATAAVKPAQPSSAVAAITTIDLQNICGKEGNVIRGFVYGGVEVARGQFPWLTAIYKKDTDALSFKCGGSLISRRTVISAAHCFKRLNAEQIVSFFGRHDLENYSEDGIISRDIQNLLIHPDYVSDTPNADLALLQIEALEKFTQHIQPICLWSESTEISLILGQTATVVGWGYEGKSNQDIAPLPKMVDMTVASNDDCLRSSAAFQQIVTDNTICAGNRDGTGPCMGDSGGGLMMLRNGRWVLRGVVSVGQSSRRRCNLYEYVVYCDTAKYMTWLRQNFLD
ncbi:serine protease gd-like isoform X2 [Eurosta solidaginis]|uniref:serine protease gd-like isoform X2 n=1 Tax=Eurosta solidaginis TaxID=178769 RepID=UPI003530CF60